MLLRNLSDEILSNKHIDFRKLTFDERIQYVIPEIFNFDYPIFDDNYRNKLETLILTHFYLRNIYQVGEFKFRLREFMQRRMSYYNKLYRSNLIEEFNPLDDINYKDVYTRRNDSDRNSEQTQITTGSQKSNSNEHNSATSNSDVHGKSDVNSTSDTNFDRTNDTNNTTNYTGDETTNNHAENVTNKKTIKEDTPQSMTDVNEHHASEIDVTLENGTQDSNGTTHTSSNQTSETKEKEDSDTKNVSHETSVSNQNTNQSGKSDNSTDTITDNSSQDNVNGNEKFKNIETYQFSRHGRNGSHISSDLIQKQREIFSDINTMLLDEMDYLFVQVYEY